MVEARLTRAMSHATPPPRLRPPLALLALVAAAGALAAWSWPRIFPAEPARWFVPGALGGEPGRAAPAAGTGAYLTRAMSLGGGEEAARWAERNGLTPSLGFSHHLAEIFPPKLHERHPEFFPLVAGARVRPQPNTHSWQPDLGRADVAAHAAAAARAHVSAQPRSASFSLGINDGIVFGESAETLALTTPMKWFRGLPDFSPLVFTFMNRAAEDLARTHPDKLLGCLAYAWAENTPGFRVHSQVVPFLTADRAQGYDAAARAEELALQGRWAAAGPKRLGLYDYLYGGGFLVPRVFPHLLAENIRHARRVGFSDYYAEVYPNWGLDGPMPWLAAQLTFDPEQSVEALLDEYFRRYFREAAVPMRKFFACCEEQWLRGST